MFGVRCVTEADKTFWFSLDRHLSDSEFILKARDRRGYIICDDCHPIGIMRYNLFWDIIPFLTLIALDDNQHRKGFGSQAMLFWESEMRNLGFKMVMTSTQVDEQAQHFYRNLGYKDKGGLFLDGTPFEQPQELLMLKVLCEQ